MPTLVWMDDREDIDLVLQWGHRLKLYAELQGAYYEHLRGFGMDEEHAFQLVREWTLRTIGWASSSGHAALLDPFAEVPPPGAAPTPPPGWSVGLHVVDDPSVAPPDEPYLLSDEDTSGVIDDADAA
jgi:hypothetical protein